MSIVLLDTNILLDAIANRPPFCVSAQKIFIQAAQETIDAHITANSLTDIYYIARKVLSSAAAHSAIEDILNVFSIVSIDEDDCKEAIDSGIDDFEDALIMVCAEKIKADYIISRDKSFQSSTNTIKILSADDFIAQNISYFLNEK
ncbi:MAG: PIN domain-containing protein [Elusimicrobiota bacterium]|jgi:predicted nucleic acid-binding protein|nr:PIN domain-containing protein [Elusimicrobiota bacterium]